MVFLRPFIISFLKELRNYMLLLTPTTSESKTGQDNITPAGFVPVWQIDRALDLLVSEKFGWSSSDIPRLKLALKPEIFSIISNILKTKTIPDISAVAEKSENKDVRLYYKLMKIWGVGPTSAISMIREHGVTGLNDVADKYELNSAQKLGLKYYKDINSPMIRAESKKIIAILQSGPRKIEVCGSYRRGLKKIKDLDVLIIGIRKPVEFRDFLFSAFENVEILNFKNRKLTALVKLPGRNKLMRHIDFRYVKQSELPAAMLYFTGNAIFGRILRQRAKRLGYKLNEYGLFVRGKNGEIGRAPLNCKSEEEIFNRLDLIFIPPVERSFTLASRFAPFVYRKHKRRK